MQQYRSHICLPVLDRDPVRCLQATLIFMYISHQRVCSSQLRCSALGLPPWNLSLPEHPVHRIVSGCADLTVIHTVAICTQLHHTPSPSRSHSHHAIPS
jgi:hypothetical protein